MNRKSIKLLILLLVTVQLNGQVLINLPDLNFSSPAGTTIEIPVTTENLSGLNVIAYQFVIEFDQNVILPESPYFLTTGTISGANGWSVMVNVSSENQMTVGAFGAYPLSGAGILLKLLFNLQLLNGATPLSFSSFLFNAGSPAVATISGSITNQECNTSQSILIPSGWSGISSYLIPSIPQMETMFNPIQSDLGIVYNFSNVYAPAFGIAPGSDWDTQSGYFIKVTDDVQLIICGNPNPNHAIPLEAGWNLVPVPLNNVFFMDEIMMNLDFEIVKEAVGCEVYWPTKNIQTLYFFEPGKAYLIKMNTDGSLVFQ